jgi:DNA-binding cell septation regulator SpoVG
MDTTPLDGYKKIIVTLLTLIAGSLGLFINDPARAQTVGQFLTDVIGPVAITVVGIIYTIVQGQIDKEKVKANSVIASEAKQSINSSSSPKVDSAAAPQPAAAPCIPAAPTDNYVPLDLDAALGSAEESCRKDSQEVTPVSRAFYFYPIITRFDLREVPREKRVDEAKRLVDKALELFSEAFKFQTKLTRPPTPAEAVNYHGYMFKLKKDYEKANNLTCSDKTFEELRNLISYFNDLYTARDGLAQLSGKTVDWSVYGSGAFTPTQVGWDYVKLS